MIDSDQNEHTLTLKDSRWARTYIDVDNRGPRVSDLTTVIAPGDIIRIQPVSKNGTTTWRLAQLPDIQGAVVAMEPTTGSIKALVGGFDFYRNQYNHALQSARQPGSSFKPFIYSAALANGVNAADVFLDAPLVFEDANLESQYRPENDNNRYNGPTRLREALYQSINLVSIRVLLEVSAGKVLDRRQLRLRHPQFSAQHPVGYRRRHYDRSALGHVTRLRGAGERWAFSRTQHH